MKTIAGGKYRLKTVIAAGSFGKVYEDFPYAIKQMRLPMYVSESKHVGAVITNEINIMTQLNHKNLVKLY